MRRVADIAHRGALRPGEPGRTSGAWPAPGAATRPTQRATPHRLGHVVEADFSCPVCHDRPLLRGGYDLPSRPLSLLSEGARSQMRQDGTGDTLGSRPSISLARRRRSSSWPHGLPQCASSRRWAKWSLTGRRASWWRPRRTRSGNAS